MKLIPLPTIAVIICTALLIPTSSALAVASLPALPALGDRAPATNEPFAGESIALKDSSSNSFTLFVPKDWHAPTNGEVTLIVHFHGIPQSVLGEYSRYGLKNPLVVAHLGEGSRVYARPFEDTNRFAEWLGIAAKTLKEHGAPENTRIATVQISSFSAGYGAVRELLKSPACFALIQRIVLCDSIYGGLQDTNKDAARIPAHESVAPWIPFVLAASRGEKTFVLTHSEVQTSYASTGEMANALIESVKAPITKSDPLPAADDKNHLLRYRSDLERFHVFGYSGMDGQAHMAHLWHLADVWQALDDAEGVPQK